MDGILHRPEAFSKNSGLQRPSEGRKLAFPFERAAAIFPWRPVVGEEGKAGIEPAKCACYARA